MTVALLPLLLGLLACVPAESGDETAGADTAADTASPPLEPPELIFVVMGDDLAANVLWAMPTVQARLVPECVRFLRAYTTVPLCCPVRASLFAGGEYPRNTGVQSNELPNGGFESFHDTDTLPTRLQAAGFRTALMGKYLNGYELNPLLYIPPGWDLFVGSRGAGNGYDTILVQGSSSPTAPGVGARADTDGAYSTDWFFERARDFVDESAGAPTVVFLTLTAPHYDMPPATEDVGTWADYSSRPPSFQEADVSDKPGWLQDVAAESEAAATDFDATARSMLESLAAIDRGIGGLLDHLDERGLRERTALVLVGDNGVLHGEHWLMGKGVPYEESVTVPLLVALPGVAARDDRRLVAMNLDLPATIADFAGLEAWGEGESLRSALADPEAQAGRDHVFIESAVGNHPVWAGVVTERWKYVEWGDGATELYDLEADPYEMESLHDAVPAAVDLDSFGAWVDEHRSLAVTTLVTAPALVEVPFSETLTAWGGTPPLRWILETGSLPDGIVLGEEGVLSGVATTAGSAWVRVRVTDSVLSPLTGEPAHFTGTIEIPVVAAQAVAAAEPLVRRLPAAVPTFRVVARPGLPVQLRASRDDTGDSPSVWSAAGRTDARGRAVLALPGLAAPGGWHLYAVVDGVEVAAGNVAP